MIPLKAQLAEDDREAIQKKIETDRALIREFKRQEAMKAYGCGHLKDAFEAIAGEDFEDRLLTRFGLSTTIGSGRDSAS